MVIGVDIDGVLTNVEEWQFRVGAEYTKKEIKDETAFDVKGIFDLTDSEYKKFLDDCLTDYAINEPCRAHASNVIKELRNNGNKIIIVTGRFHTSEDTDEGLKQRNIVFNWLNKNKIEYDKIIFTSPSDNKKEILIKNNIEVMIEDKATTILSLAEIMHVICFDAKYNQGCDNENVYRVYCWKDILNVINTLSFEDRKF